VSPATNAFNTIIPSIAANRCAALQTAGLITGADTAAQAASALAQLRSAGWQAESDVLHAAHYAFAVPAVTLTYANSYGRFGVQENLCGYSYAATGTLALPPLNAPVAASLTALATSFGVGNGVPPTLGINIVNNLSAAGPLRDAASFSADLVLNYNAPGALCLRELAIGNSDDAQRVQSGVSKVLRSANLRGKPALIVHGRADTLVPVAFTSRPYFGLNKIVEGSRSKLAYIEVAFLGFPGFGNRFVPLHRYFNQAMDLMYAHLKTGAPLPESQVVRTTPRGLTGAVVNAITPANVPPIQTVPATGDAITFANNVVTVAN